jgi:hypothetical protein
VGLCAFSGTLCGLKLVPSKWRYLVSPTSPHQGAGATGNASRWAADVPQVFLKRSKPDIPRGCGTIALEDKQIRYARQ